MPLAAAPARLFASGVPPAAERGGRSRVPEGCPGRLLVAKALCHGQPYQRRTHQLAWKSLPRSWGNTAIKVLWNPAKLNRCNVCAAAIFLE